MVLVRMTGLHVHCRHHGPPVPLLVQGPLCIQFLGEAATGYIGPVRELGANGLT